MKRTLFSICGAVLLFAALPARADVTLSLSPSTQTVFSGTPAVVALTIAGLGDLTSPSLSAFDVDIFYDPSVLSFTRATFGDPILGDELDVHGLGGNPQFAGTFPPDGLNLFEISLDTPADLNALQHDSFTLALLRFPTLKPGNSTLGIVVNALGDANGDPFTTRILTTGADIRVVPEPDALSWLAIAVVAFVLGQRQRARMRT